MLVDVVLPNLGFGMEEGQLLAWLKAPGDAVRKGDALAEIEGDKTTVELEALADGVLEEQLVPPGHIVPVGTVLARIRSLADDARDDPPAARMDTGMNTGVDTAPAAPLAPAVAAPAPPPPAPRVLAAPAVRRLARDHGIALEQLAGSGPGGRITRADLAARLPAQPAAPAREALPLSTMRQIIARRLARGMQEMPLFHVRAELDFSQALRALPPDVGVNALLLWLTIRALQDVPHFNATFEQGTLWRHTHIDLAQAVALPDGLLTPVLRHVERESLTGLAQRSAELVARARQGRLRPEELQGGSFTLSNLGVVRQIDDFTAIINPPQVGILAVGALRERPVVIDGGLHIRHTARLTVTADHRIVDGMLAARLLAAFDAHLQAFGAPAAAPA